jgi:hypothetical protein
MDGEDDDLPGADDLTSAQGAAVTGGTGGIVTAGELRALVAGELTPAEEAALYERVLRTPGGQAELRAIANDPAHPLRQAAAWVVAWLTRLGIMRVN